MNMLFHLSSGRYIFLQFELLRLIINCTISFHLIYVLHKDAIKLKAFCLVVYFWVLHVSETPLKLHSECYLFGHTSADVLIDVPEIV